MCCVDCFIIAELLQIQVFSMPPNLATQLRTLVVMHSVSYDQGSHEETKLGKRNSESVKRGNAHVDCVVKSCQIT